MTKQLCWQNKTINIITVLLKDFSQCKKGAQIFEAHEEHNGSGLWLPSRLWSDGLAVLCHHQQPHVSVIVDSAFLFPSILQNLFRQCDSRNLNLDPLCMLRAGSLPALWTERVIKDHIKTFAVLILGERDLQNLWQLNPLLHLNLVQPDEEKTQGPAACHRVKGKTLSCKCVDVYFNRGWVLQRLGRGHCCCQHLLWEEHRYRWEGSYEYKIYLKSCQSLSEASEWVLWTSLPPSEGSLDSALDSASSHSLRSSTGF